MKRLLLTFKDFFDCFSASNELNKVHTLKKKIYVKNPQGKLIRVNGVIKKNNCNIVKVDFSGGIEHRCSDLHLFKTDTGFKIANTLTKNDNILCYNSCCLKVKNIEPVSSNSYAYDISLDYPHEYVTPNGLIHHNTTTARIVVDAIVKNDMDLFTLNGSDSTGVDMMRNEIQGFLKSPPYASKLKIVFIDEFDYTTGNAQAALRNIMETYADNGRFICTGNYLSKIIDPVQSRFQIFEMKSIKEDFAYSYCKKILEAEHVEYDIDTLKLIVHNFMPDVRKAVNMMQKNVVDGKLKKIDATSIISSEKKICGLIVQICDDMGSEKRDKTINQCMPEIMKLLSQDEPDYRGIYQTLSFLDNLPLWAKIKVNQYNNAHQSCALPSAHFMALCYDIVSAGINYFRMFKK